MNHQITLEELGILPKQEPQKAVKHIDYAFPCGGCICNHCANSMECWDECTGEAVFGCFACEDCKWWGGKGTDNRRSECKDYKITEAYAKVLRKRFKALKPETL